jgi:hypothetical protein
MNRSLLVRLVALLLTSATASAQQYPVKGTLNTVYVPAGSTFTVPATGHFVMLSWAGELSDTMVFANDPYGVPVGAMVFPPGDVLTCVQTGGAGMPGSPCMINFVLENQ